MLIHFKVQILFQTWNMKISYKSARPVCERFGSAREASAASASEVAQIGRLVAAPYALN